MFSKACEYGIRAVIYIATQSLQGKRVSLHAIAEEIDSPPPFTAKILQVLSKEGIVSSLKGPTGGFTIDVSSAKSATLKDVVLAIDGGEMFSRCGLGLKQCTAEVPCPLHNEFAEVRRSLSAMLEGTRIVDLASGIEAGTSRLKI